ncbi:MFS transporter [Nocardia terpenica]|uniref:MFS transporter n=1 Tax=Nocardia terpenica TaxID=455432 RepID=UPI001893ED6E|nr:MFS transporter [Nocardia terpenica]MBF6059205.1 MFS transporter [Nocardia terpenica]MBF6103256.1 MFS transporter [Nocardia terpenica]MBF6110555.1 MFS transporter [Nocardia terpenica]MBF6116686.1 MFS transporter [Nocardia terpenica]
MPLALLALMISAFALGSTEFVLNGLLPEVSRDLDVSISTAGLLISGYALGVVAGALLLTAATTRMRRKTVLLWLLALFVIGNTLCALAPGYGLLMVGRIVSALTHGAFFGVATVVAAGLVSPDRRAGAIAAMFTGLTLANVLGVPAGTVVGQHLGWRTVFWGVALLGLIGLIGIATLVPSTPADPDAGLRRELTVFRRPQVWLALAMTAAGISGLFLSFTYIAPMMTTVAGFAESSMAWLLVLYGAGLVVGNLIGGRVADRSPRAALLGSLSLLVAVLLVFTATVHATIPAAVTLALLGAAGFGLVPIMQSWMLRHADGAPTLAAAANIAAFNAGAALAAWLGGRVIDGGLGYPALNWVGALLSAAGLLLAAVAVCSGRTTRASRRMDVSGDSEPLLTESAVH